MNVHMEVWSISRRAKEEDGGIERLWRKCGGRLRLTCEGSQSGGDERAHSNEARVFQYRHYSKRETCHLLAQLIDLLLRSRVEGIPRAEYSTLAITEELPRADLIAAGCKKS